jgi:hypothetical protein
VEPDTIMHEVEVHARLRKQIAELAGMGPSAIKPTMTLLAEWCPLAERVLRRIRARPCSRSWRVLPLSAVVLLVALGWLTAASATPTARFTATFTPDRLGASTTITLMLHVGVRGGEEPQPLRMLDIEFPEHLGLASSTLGLVSCNHSALLASGPTACPANSRVGEGKIKLQEQLGSELVHEDTAISIYMGKAVDRHNVFEFYASGSNPIIADFLFEGALLSAGAPFGSDMQTSVPSTELFPGGSPAAVVSMRLVIGPRNLIYYRTVHGKRVGYRPAGISVPESCSRRRHSFPFLARLSFANGSYLDASASVPCRR